MENILVLSKYICDKYREETTQIIDEMKLHKLLYFTQREALIQTDMPLFSEIFEAWKYGPVCIEVRTAYNHQLLEKDMIDETPSKLAKQLANDMINKYGYKNSWSLSRLTHCEISWINARVGIPEGHNGNNLIQLEDIRIDAEKIKLRRVHLKDKKDNVENNYNSGYVVELREEEYEALFDEEVEIINIPKKIKELEKRLRKSGIKLIR